ncbi:MAG TPA: cold shock domain-containing protein [Candidatus Paceibacterota bacterium]|nr:cold shock domain-containing protein [Candidatus Pacearchaeota archaeon]HRZ51080.1 cold shock domain-containing protein [Candidatus Paceibacterota bacterium]HSA36761.1 cold shock domain-containing protein [Candidatus Paceibacterota bacterium]
MRGIVKYFNPAKKFGFIKGSDGKEFFFHTTAYRIFDVKKGQVAFIEAVPKKAPKEGDEIIFIEGQGPKGAKAEYWTFVADLEQRAQVDPSFIGAKLRVVKIWVKDGHEEKRTLWKGSRPGALGVKMRRTGDPRTDPLLPGPSETILFQINAGNGWQECEDFRPMAL